MVAEIDISFMQSQKARMSASERRIHAKQYWVLSLFSQQAQKSTVSRQLIQ
ncbi:MAG: hypothetical protein PUP92_23495 [Rhizonema sp. PD38]|nr:hypothetical protein [Rhizonema sp. PD38]